VHRTSMNLTSNIRPSRILEGVEKFENNLEELQKLTTEIADKVAALQDFKGDKSFRNAALDYLEHLENYVYIDAPEYISLIRNYAERYNEIEKEEVNAINKIVDKMNSESDFQGNKFEKAQSVFAKKYNFRLLPGKILH
ncbi:MAG: hypothetical protein KAS97_01385, partial [Candidatus Aminicenantes bacterium]|nr:hypothetical protein [Candidatus Aminicenantes bacterium]